MITEKEKLEAEIKLLKESLELEVITKDEYGTAKERIEEKISLLEPEEEKKIEIKELKEESDIEQKEDLVEEEAAKEEVSKEEPKETEIVKEEITAEHKVEDTQKSEISDTTDSDFSTSKPKDFEDTEEGQKTLEEVKEEKPEEEVKSEEKPEEKIKEEELVPISKSEEGKPEEVEEKKGLIKTIVFSGIFIVLILIAYFYFFGGSQVSADGSNSLTPISLIACSSDKDCMQEEKIGLCSNPGEENAECEYIEDVKVQLTILNNDCFNCDNKRVLSILNNFFPNINAEKINFETSKGKEIAETFDITVLPAYILDSNFKEAYNYNKLANAFNEVDGNFIMKNTVSNANFYISREEISNKLDLFVKANQVASLTAEDNLEEFLDEFEDDVNFEKHDENSEIVKELGINTFPAFLVNNKIKFSGVQAADVIKDNFCRMNELNECSLDLTKSLV
ncbi:hypothetical protein CMO94_03670 [Candidatus Woesearchaeota archaeon]|jgi:hypothetical protein|nr:hypothetical protein [Candidatus Woesearchaeota archaeon]|tara:strand:+ start:5445 stop:6797 length:1353 start_codon:yes stop_codon:yes gene_type:complete